MYDLKLAVNLNGWRIFVRRREDKAFLPVSQQVLNRDNYTCQFCGFQAREFQEIINLDGNYMNNKLANMATACCFCSQCLFLESVSLDEMGGGQLVYLPEISQANLNSFCHVLFCALGNGTGYQDTSQTIYRSLKFRSQQIENKFGAGMSNPTLFGQVVLEYKAQSKEFDETPMLQNIRLLPTYTKFKVQLDAWAKAALEELNQEGAAKEKE